MKLSQLEINNFCGIERGTLTLGNRTLITGMNASGKSTIRDAIEFALTGKCRGVDLKKDAHALVRKGATECEVALEILIEEGKPEYTIKRTNAGLKSGVKDSVIAKRINPNLVSALLSPFRLPDMTPAERRDLAKLLADDSKAVRDAVWAFGEKQDLASDDLEEVAGKAETNIDRAETLAIEFRRAAKRRAAEKQPEPESKVTVGGKLYDFEKVSEDSIRGRLIQVESLAKAKREEVGKAAAESNQKVRDLVKAQRELSDALAVLDKETPRCKPNCKDHCPETMTKAEQEKKRKELLEIGKSLAARETELKGAKPDESLAKEAEEAEGRVRLGRSVIEACLKYKAQVEALEKTDESGFWAKEAGAWDAVVKFLSKDGELRRQFAATAQDALKPVVKAICTLTGGKEVLLTGEWEITVGGVPAALLSRSERFRVGAAFALGIARASELGFIVLDEVDILDQPGRAALAKQINENFSDIQVIMLCTGPEQGKGPSWCSNYIHLGGE